MNLLPEQKTADYVKHYNSRCRECADNRGVCPNCGLPCHPKEREQAIKSVIDAINYGVGAGYLTLPRPQRDTQ